MGGKPGLGLGNGLIDLGTRELLLDKESRRPSHRRASRLAGADECVRPLQDMERCLGRALVRG